MKKYNLILLLSVVLLTGCNNKPSQIRDSYIYLQNKGRENKDWQLIWEDDFDGSELDTTKWTRITPGKPDWRKHMSTDDKCYSISDGKLYLLGINNPDTTSDPRPFLTGGVYTRRKFAFQYGKIEIHAKLESAQGAWPAIWMLAEQNKYGNYPKNGEIDIMEHINFEDIVYHTTHSHYTINLEQTDYPDHGGIAWIDTSSFNTFGLEWYPDKLVFIINDNVTFTYPKVEDVHPSQWPYDQPFYILIDQQLGGDWVGKVNPLDLPVRMIIDFVKVYQ
ncbi:glycoside hydrolase family 16 protein [Bacteroidota bacterium]